MKGRRFFIDAELHSAIGEIRGEREEFPGSVSSW